MSNDTEAPNKNEGPDRVGFPDPASPLVWAEVYRQGELVGAVWITEQPNARPRAGIVLEPNGDGDVMFQQDLGAVALEIITDNRPVAQEWIDHLSETRTGVGDTLQVGGAQRATSVREVARAIGWRGI